MILPGTLVQYLGGVSSTAVRLGLLHPMGIYTVRAHRATPHPMACPVCRPQGMTCDSGGLELERVFAPAGVETEPGFRSVGAFTVCSFRILAPPITEADRLEMSAPDNDGAKQPAKRKETV